MSNSNFPTMCKKCVKHVYLLLALSMAMFKVDAQLTNIPVTGFTNDVVANGVGATNTATTGTLPGVTYPTMGLDANIPTAYSFIDATYKWYSASTLPTCFLPTGGAIPSALTTGLTYQLQSYSANNALTVASNTFTGSVHPTTGTLSLSTPASYGKLYVLYESVMNTAGPTITATITFTDATTQVISGNALVNWFTATGVAYTPSISRAGNTAPGAAGACATGPYLFEMGLSINPANYGKLVQSVTFNWSAATGTSQQTCDYFHALALGGIPPCAVPADQPTALNLTSPSGTIITGTFTAATSAPTGYLAVGYLTGATPTAPQSGTTYTVGSALGAGIVVGSGPSTSLTASGLLPGQSYDVYIYAYNGGVTCAVAYNTISPLTGTLSTSTVGATTLINPYGDGGFENGTTFASNGWTVVNGATNNWFVGTAAVPFSGSRSAYIDNGTGATNQYTNSSASTVHFYRDVTFPAGQNAINLSFRWKGNGEASYDYVTVYLMPNNITPLVNTPPGAFQSWLNFPTAYPGAVIYCTPPNLNLQANYQTQNICLPASLAGTTRRLVFAWSNDPSVGTQSPGSVDEISLVSSTPIGPADQATALTLTTISTSQINVSYTAATSGPAGYLVVRYPTGAAVTNPSSGTVYSVGATLGLGTVAYVGAATSFNSTGLSGNTTYDYYVYSYYNSTCPNGSIYNTSSPLTGTQTTSPCGTLTGTIPVGPTAPASPAGFTNLTTALVYINTNGLGGATVLELQSDYVSTSETFPIVFPFNACVNAVNTLTVRPASGVTSALSISTSNATAAIDLNGATNVTFDGRPGGAGAIMLNIINTATTAISTIRMINDARNNTITYCDVQGASVTSANPTTSGIIFMGSTTGISGNDNNTISYNNIHAAGSTLPTIGIGAYNSTTAGAISNNDNNTISNNNIYDFFSPTLATTGIKIDAGNNAVSITDNRIYQTAPRAYTAAVAFRGIWLNTNSAAATFTHSSGHTVTGNYIGGNNATGTGVMTFTSSSTTPAVGMDISVGNGAGTTVSNNTITNISFQSSSIATVTTGQFTAMSINYGNVNNISNNNIGSTGTGITVLSAGATIATLVAGIRIGGGILSTNISNNNIGNINANMTTNTVAHTVVGLLFNGGTVNPTVTNNNIGPLTSGTGSTTATGSAQVLGMYSSVAIVSPTFTGNTIHDLSNFAISSGTGATGIALGGIVLNNTAINTTVNVSNNSIYNLVAKGTSTSLTYAPYIQGIFLSIGTTGTHTINANNIHSFSVPNWNPSGTTTGIPLLSGINTVSSSNLNITNNMIRLGIDLNGNSVTQPVAIRAIYRQSASGNYNIWNNAVYVGGTGVTASTGAFVTASFFRQVAGATEDIRNNIFVNQRTNAASATGIKHYAVYLGATSLLTLGYNVYNYGSTPTNLFGYNSTADVASYASGWVSGDNYSQTADPQFVNPTGNAASVDLHINPSVGSSVEQNGIFISALALDYDGQTRMSLTPVDIGADAGNFTPLNACNGTPSSSTATLTNASYICTSGTKTIYLASFTPQPGLTYQWQESATGGAGTFTNVTAGVGATTNVYNTGTITSSTYFQCEVTCTATGLSTTSFPVQVIVPGLFPGGYYTIDNTLSSGGGNFASFTEAVNALVCGIAGPIIFDVAAGTGPYTEQINIPQITGASATNTITFLGNNQELTYNATLAAQPYTLSLNGADYFRFNDLRITGTNATYALAAHLWNQADNNIFTNCIFTVPLNGTSTSQVPFSCSGTETSATAAGPSGNNNILDGCTMNSGYYNTCFVGNSTGPAATGNQVINCNIRDQYFYASYNLYQNGLVISGNTFERATRTTLSTYYGVFISTGCSNLLVEKNKFRNTWGSTPASIGTQYTIYSSISPSVGNENKIYNNLISDINFNGTLYGLYLIGSNNVKVYHNTISFDQTGASGTTTTYGIYATGTTGIDIKNNNITISRGGAGVKYALYFTSATGILCNYNNLYVTSTAGTNCIGFYVSGFNTLAAWQGANGGIYDQQSMSVDPSYLNPSLYDYHPTSVNLNNTGTNLGVTTDITGAPRSSTPDIGCYEFFVNTTDAGVLNFVSPGPSGCYTSTENVEVTIKNFGASTLDFAVNPLTVYCDITGMITTQVSGSPVGTLAPGATMNVVLGPAVDMTLNGTYSFNAYSVMSGDLNAANDALPVTPTRTVAVTAGTISTGTSSLCLSGSPTFTITGNYGGAIQWQESAVSTSGPWTNVGSGTATYTTSSPYTSDVFVQAVVSCNGNTATTNVISIIVSNPTVVSTVPGSRCGVGTVNLSATGSAGTAMQWFANPSGGVAIGFGNNFTTPSISSTTNFYTEAVTGSGTLTGLGNTTFPTASGFNAKRGIQFNAYQSFTLLGFDFPAAFAGTTNLTVELQSSTGTVLQTATLNETNTNATLSWHSVPLNWIIPAGTGYKLLCQFNTGSLSNYSHSTGANYASAAFNNLGPVGLITNGLDFGPVVSTTAYYYFYNIKISAGCNSTRVPVLATVNTPPAVSVSSTSTTLCLGQSATLNVTSPNDPDYTYTWNPGGLTGASVTVSPVATTTYTLSAVDNTTGTYQTCANSATITITVNPVPTPVTVTPASVAVCSGSAATLTASGGTIGGIYTLGTGVAANSSMGITPYGSFYEGQRNQYLIQASELTALGMVAGVISNMAFDVVLPGPGTYPQLNFTVKLGQTSTNAFSAAYITPTGGFTTVYGPSSQGAPSVGWNTLAFTNTFTWDGISNILIDICHENDALTTCGACYSTSSSVNTTTTSFNSVYSTYADNTYACGVSASIIVNSTVRPNIRFNSFAPTAMTWSPSTGLNTTTGSTVQAGPTVATTYTVTATSTLGCTATQSAAVTVNQPTTSSTTQTACDAYVWNATTYTASGTYTMTSLNANGCLHTETLNLTINNSSTSSTTASACSSYTWAANSTTYTASGTFTATSLNASGCTHTETLNLTIAPCNTSLALTMFIQGYWDGAGAMLPVLFNQGQSNPATDCDTITVELYDAATLPATPPYTPDYTTKAVLHTNGTATAVFSSAVSGNYYIVIKHRNALQTWSAAAQAFPATASYNFSSAATQAYGANQTEVATGVWALYSGDIVVDENMDLLDLAQLETDVSEFVFGYNYDPLNTNYPGVIGTDINGDGNVDLLDSPPLEANISNFVFSAHP